MPRLYLDNCCFNRPFDDQSQLRVRLETESKLEVQQRIRDGRIELAWSYMLDFENAANPFDERREAIARWKAFAITDVAATPELLAIAHNIARLGLRPKDALHVACAIAANCASFLTTDDIMLKKARSLDTIKVVNPTEYIIEVGR